MQIDTPEKTAIPLSSPARRRTAVLVVALSACAGALTLAACGDERPASPPTTVAPPTVSPAPAPDAPSKASRDGGDGRDETAGEPGPAEQDDEAPDDGFKGDRLVRGLGPRGHDAR